MALEEVGLRAVIEGTDVYAADAKRIQQAEQGIVAQGNRTAAATKENSFRFTELKSALSLAGDALRLVESAYRSVIVPTVAYAKEVRDLSRTIGASAEESSKLIQAADDVGVSVGSLEGALKAAIRKGISPTVEGLGKLADQYNAIQDPIERTKFLMDTFGRSGADLAPLMEKGAEGIAALGDEAERLGLVLSEEDVRAAREFEIAIDNLEDAGKGLAYTFGNKVIPVLTEVATQINDSISASYALNKAFEKGAISSREYSHYLNVLRSGKADEAKITAELEKRIRSSSAASSVWAERMRIARAAADENREATAGLNDQMLVMELALAGALGKEVDTFTGKQTSLARKIAETEAAIRRLKTEQGKQVVVEHAATGSAEELFIAQDRLLSISYKLGTAQQELAEAQAVGDLDAIHKAQVALAGITIEYNNAGEAVQKLGGYTETLTADTKKKTAEQIKILAELQAQYRANAEEHEKATARILLDIIKQVIANENAKNDIKGFTDDQVLALLKIEHEWGLLDKKTYEATLSIMGSTRAAATSSDWATWANNILGLGAAWGVVPTSWKTTYTVETQRVGGEVGDVGTPAAVVAAVTAATVTAHGQPIIPPGTPNVATPGNLRWQDRQAGGLVWPGQAFNINEVGRESFFGLRSGILEILRGSQLTPRESGVVIPAPQTRELISPALIAAGGQGGGAVTNSQSVSVGPNYISNPMTQAQFNQRLRQALGA